MVTNEAVFSKTLKGRGKAYFFDVKVAKNGKKYLNIKESRYKDGDYEYYNIIIFEEDFLSVKNIFDELVLMLKV